jgi:hypothetical protein
MRWKVNFDLQHHVAGKATAAIGSAGIKRATRSSGASCAPGATHSSSASCAVGAFGAVQCNLDSED